MSNKNIIAQDIKDISKELIDNLELYEGQHFFIAGGAGFLGRYLVNTLIYLNKHHLSNPCKITIADNFVSGQKEWLSEVSKDVNLLEKDISEAIEIDGDIDYIIHAASIASPVFYHKLRIETIKAGVQGTISLLELAKEKKVKSFLFISSSEVYGDPDPKHIPTDEEYNGNVSFTGPRACYDEPKRIGETICMNYGEIYNLPIKIARPFNIFGPGIRLDDGRVMPAFTSAALKGKELPVHGTGNKTRTFCYINNATIGFFKILMSDYNLEAFNIGADSHEIKIRHLAEIIIGLVEHPNSKINLTEDLTDVYKETNPERRCPDLSKIRTMLGYKPKINLVKGLKRFITWMETEINDDNEDYIIEKNCRICNSTDLKSYLDLGQSPLANNLREEGEEEKPTFPLEVMYCSNCHNSQLSCSVNPDLMFKDYAYVSSTTKSFRQHFGEMAKGIFDNYIDDDNPLIVDIGSNDGLLLKKFKDLGCRVVGVEPAGNIAEIARKEGIDTINSYFNKITADEILKFKGAVDVITANNVFAHTRQIHSIAKNVKRILKDNGIFVIEIQYLPENIKNTTFDNVYHEHVSYFSLISLKHFFDLNEMEVFNVEKVSTHGGSLRVYVQKESGNKKVDASVDALLKEEYANGMNKFETFKEFGERIHKIKNKITAHIEGLNQEATVIGYGAPAKATTLLNFCNITNDNIKTIIDDNPLKQDKILPGTGIPIVSSDILNDKEKLNIVILAWNFADEIVDNIKNKVNEETTFLTPLPIPKKIEV